MGEGFFVFTVFHVKNEGIFGEKVPKLGSWVPWVGSRGPREGSRGPPGGGARGGGARGGPRGVPDLCRVNRALTG